MDVKSKFMNGYIDEEVYVNNHKDMKLEDKRTKCTQ